VKPHFSLMLSSSHPTPAYYRDHQAS
jgi:hypothetical protein